MMPEDDARGTHTHPAVNEDWPSTAMATGQSVRASLLWGHCGPV